MSSWVVQVLLVFSAISFVFSGPDPMWFMLLVLHCLTINQCNTDIPWYGIQSFQFFSPNCTLHTVITHVILALEQRSLMHDYAIRIHVRLQPSNTVMWVLEVCNVQPGLKPLKQLYYVTFNNTSMLWPDCSRQLQTSVYDGNTMEGCVNLCWQA